jgi:NAD(P)-dependent dehydrogenase (short-subunit alcohol dehydrogenase family)
MEFEDKVAVVTGGAQGIGAACAEALAADGAKLALLDLRYEDGEPEPDRLTLRCDVADARSVERAFAAVRERFGRVDVLVNNAGIGHAGATPALEEETWDRVIDVILKGTLLCSQHVGPAMVEQRSGAIVNVASMMGLTFFPNRAAYCSAKAGVIALTKVTANEWAPYGVRVNAVAPGYIRTAIFEDAVAAGVFQPERIEEWTPMARLGTVDEVAHAVRWLASDKASFVTGHALVIDGGFTSYGAWWPPAEARA